MERIPFEQGMLLNKGQRLSIHLIVAGLVLRTYRGNLVVADPLYLECDEFCRMASLYRYVVGFLTTSHVQNRPGNAEMRKSLWKVAKKIARSRIDLLRK